MKGIPQGCISVGGIELHTHYVPDPVTGIAIMPGPGELVSVKRTFVPGEGLEQTVKLYDGDPLIDISDPNVMIFDGCIPR